MQGCDTFSVGTERVETPPTVVGKADKKGLKPVF